MTRAQRTAQKPPRRLRKPLPNPDEQPTMTIPEAGTFLGLARCTAYEAAARGEIPTLTFGRRKLVPTAVLREMLGLGNPPP
ncbi:helix-turn-helix domain-containing protein [Nonomuraea sp. NPDC050394]|uniref:helix-turn-helix domain-containing protein n=1 Tax=Nonomuraea sp. NPDC050394 TaxID=3364363 RepID=UPI0037A61E4E